MSGVSSEYNPATYDPRTYEGGPPPTFDAFLARILDEIPEFRPVVDEQIRLDSGETYATAIFDTLSSAAMQRQRLVLEGEGTERDEAIVTSWLALAEAAMADPYVADTFLQTAGDDFLWDASGPSLHWRLGPTFRAERHKRYPDMITERRF